MRNISAITKRLRTDYLPFNNSIHLYISYKFVNLLHFDRKSSAAIILRRTTSQRLSLSPNYYARQSHSNRSNYRFNRIQITFTQSNNDQDTISNLYLTKTLLLFAKLHYGALTYQIHNQVLQGTSGIAKITEIRQYLSFNIKLRRVMTTFKYTAE